MAEIKKAEAAKEAKAKIKEIKKEEEKKEQEKAEKKEEKTEEKKKIVKKPEKKEEEKPEEVLAEKIITIPLRDAWKAPRTRRAMAAIKVLKEQVRRHTKKIPKLDLSINQAIWKKGIQKPPRSIKVKLKITKDFARVYPTE